MEHILRRREWEEDKRSASLPALTDGEKAPYSAAHTLAFLRRREWEEGKRSASLPALTDGEKAPYSAAHTLAFIQKDKRHGIEY